MYVTGSPRHIYTLTSLSQEDKQLHPPSPAQTLHHMPSNPVACPLAVESVQLKDSGRLRKKARIPAFMQVKAELPNAAVLVIAPSSQTSTRCGTLMRRRTRTPEQTPLRKRFLSRIFAPLELKSFGLKLSMLMSISTSTRSMRG